MQRCRRIDRQGYSVQFYRWLTVRTFYHQLSPSVTGCWTQKHRHGNIRRHHIIFTTHQGSINMCSILHPRFIFTKNSRAYNPSPPEAPTPAVILPSTNSPFRT
jgi:hypothetical protein